MSDRVTASLFVDEKLDLKNFRTKHGKRSSQNTHQSGLERINEVAINEKYVRGDTRIVTEQARYPLDTVRGLIESGKYELNPRFQRRRRWSIERKSRLIESFIVNIPIPPVFLYEKSLASFEVMDGQQRISAIYDFYTDAYALTGLSEWSELNGLKYSQLPEKIKGGIDRRYLSSIILLEETAKTDEDAQRLKQLVFDRINSGGIQLEEQESRNAIYAGPLNELCNKIADENLAFKKLWFFPYLKKLDLDKINGDEGLEKVTKMCEESESYRKMDDVELILRFFAYRHLKSIPRSLPLRDTLDEFLRQGNHFPETVLDNYRELFENTMDLVMDVLKTKAFQFYRKTNRANSELDWTNKPLKVVYDPIMYAFSQKLEYSEVLIQNKECLIEEIKDFYVTNSTSFSGRKTTATDIDRRIDLMFEFLEDFISRKSC